MLRRWAPRNDGVNEVSRRGRRGRRAAFLCVLCALCANPINSSVPAANSLRQAQAERNRCLPNPAQAEPVEAGLCGPGLPRRWAPRNDGVNEVSRRERRGRRAAFLCVLGALCANPIKLASSSYKQPSTSSGGAEQMFTAIPLRLSLSKPVFAALDCRVAALLAMTG